MHVRRRRAAVRVAGEREPDPSRAVVHPAGVSAAVGCLLLLLVGCGGSDQRASSDQLARARQRQKEQLQQDELDAKADVQAVAKEAAQRKAILAAQLRKDSEESTQTTARVQRPADLAKWKKQDYLDAKAQRDPRFLEAIQYVGDHFADNAGAAATIVELLRKDTRTALGQGTRIGRTCRPEEIKALIEALADNRTDTARQALGDIVAGRCPTDNDRVAVEAVLRLPLREPTPENEAILLGVLTSPATSTEGAWPAGLKQQIDRVVGEILRSPALSSGFRKKLAESVCRPENASPYAEAIRGSLTEASLSNVPAQGVLLENSDLIEVPADVLASYFAAYGSAAVCREMEMPPPDAAATRSLGGGSAAARARGGLRRALEAAAAEPEALADVTRTIWSESMAAWVERRLYRIESIEEDAVIVALASTMPIRSTRQALCEALTRNWPDGPGALEALGVARLVTSEPGFVASLKSAAGEWADQSRGRAGRTVPRRRSGSVDEDEGSPQPPGVDERWSALIKEVVLAQCERIAEAAVRREALARKSAEEDSPQPLPIKLHPDARVIHRYFEEWVDDGVKSGVARAPMRLHFVRCQETTVPDRLVRYYQQQLRNGRLFADQRAAWLTDLRDDESGGWRRSADVFIERASAASSPTPNTPEKVSVTILIVEVPGSPSRRTTAAGGRRRRP